jgi:antitoxin component of MazEF toxin-antitoxin module
MPDIKLRKIGNGTGLILPIKHLRDMGVSVNDLVDVTYDSVTKEIIIRNKETASSQDARLKRLVKDAVIEALSEKG